MLGWADLVRKRIAQWSAHKRRRPQDVFDSLGTALARQRSQVTLCGGDREKFANLFFKLLGRSVHTTLRNDLSVAHARIVSSDFKS